MCDQLHTDEHDAGEPPRGPPPELHPAQRAGGAQAGREYLSAGLVDEMQLHVVPTLLGGGERLFDNVADLHGLALVETVATPNVVHLKFARQ